MAGFAPGLKALDDDYFAFDVFVIERLLAFWKIDPTVHIKRWSFLPFDSFRWFNLDIFFFKYKISLSKNGTRGEETNNDDKKHWQVSHVNSKRFVRWNISVAKDRCIFADDNLSCLPLFIVPRMFPDMKFFLSFLFTVFCLISLSTAQETDGLVTVFDGKNMDNIETAGNWKIQKDGSLYLEPREGETDWKRYDCYIWLKEQYADFVVDFEYKHKKGGNSGLYFRCADKVDPTKSGFEVQIMDSTGKPDSEMGHHDLGGVIKTKGASKNMSKPNGEWNRMIVTMKGSHLTVVLNGEKIQDFDLEKERPKDKPLPAKGWIGIQDHGIPFWVRNLKVKKL